jgi:hypothetical protein
MRITSSAISKRLAKCAIFFAGAAAVASALLIGCGLGGNSFTALGSAGATPQARFQGKVFASRQPVSGATIQLYSVGTGGTASAAIPLIARSITTNSSGQFAITGTSSCASATQVYIVATGGNAGSGTNSSLSLMAALGPCSALGTSTFININELTTIAAVYALSPYMTDYAHIGATGSNPSGLVNAFNTANLLVDSGLGASPTPPAGMTLPPRV